MDQFCYLVRFLNPVQDDWRVGTQTKIEKKAQRKFQDLRERVGTPEVQTVEMIRIRVGSGNDFQVIGKA